MKLNDILNRYNVSAYGFPAFKGLEDKSNKDGMPVVLSSLSPVVMLDMGINGYFSPIIPRNCKFSTPEEIVAADLGATLTCVEKTSPIKDPGRACYPGEEVVIVSRHPGTIAILKGMYPNSKVLSEVENVVQIQGRDVVGTLPPHLIQYAKKFQGVVIKDFDYTRDVDIEGDELKDRLIMPSPISVRVQSFFEEKWRCKAEPYFSRWNEVYDEIESGTVWCNMFLDMLRVAYPDLKEMERLEKAGMTWLLDYMYQARKQGLKY